MASLLSPVAAPGHEVVRLVFGGGLVLCLTALFALATASPAAAYEHPPIDFDELQMVPERGWGVSGQRPSSTQTETLDVLVWDMVLSGDRMFVGGAFLNVQESKDATPISQPYLAAFDVVTGDWVDTFTPSFDRAIYALEVLPNGSILVGGEFENVNGTQRRGLVAIDPQTGQIDPTFEGAVDRPWSSRRATVRDLEVEGGTGRIYVVGSFSHLDGVNGSRFSVSKAGRFSDATGTIDRNWRPVVSGGAVWGVDSDPSGGQVAFAGWFSSVNGNSNTRNFHAVDDVTGASMPNKIPWSFNDNSRPEVYDLAYSDDALFLAGSQHYVATVDKTTHRRLAYSYTGNRARGWGWSSQAVGGDYQSAEVIGDYLVTGCHCTNGNNNHYDSITGRVTTYHNVLAYDATTGRHNEAFDVDIESPRDGQWAAASDETGCLWIGGDYHLGGTESGKSRWLGGFGRLCPELRSPQISNTDNRVATLNDTINLPVEASGNNATYSYTASNLPTGLTMDPTTGLVTGTITEVGVYEVTVTATIIAGQGLSGSKSFTWTVMDDSPPVVTPIEDQVKVAGTTTVIPVTGTDDEGSQLRWTAWGMEGQLTIDAITGEISGKVSSAGELTVTVQATDIVGLSDIEQFTLTTIDGPSVAGFGNHRNYNFRSDGNYAIGPLVQFDEETILTHLGVHDANRNGQIDNPGPTTVAIYRQSDRQELARIDIPADTPIEDDFAYAELDQRITLQPNVTYAIAALLTRGGEPFSEFGNLDLGPGVRTVGRAYTVTTTMKYPSTQSSDGRNRYFGPGIKIADNADPSPVVEAISDQFNAVDLSVARQITATSPGGLTLTYAATSLPDGLTINPTTGIIGGTPTGEGISATVVTVTDSLGLTTSRSFDWIILDSDPPVIERLADRVVLERKPLSIRPVLTEADPNATWTATGLPTGVSIDETTGVISGKPLEAGKYDVTVTATDLVDLEGEESFQITVIGAPSVAAFSNHRNYTSRNSGNYAIGPLVQFDEETILTHLGVHDANRNGQIDNPGPTTVAVYRQSDRQELARIEIPVEAPIEDDFAYAELDQRIVLQPKVTYAFAALLPRGGEPFSEFGSLDMAPGVRAVGRAYTGTTTMKYPSTQSSDGRNRYFGPGIKILDENVDPTPVIEPIGDLFDAVDLPISRQVNATSPAGASLTYAATGLPTGLVIDAASGEITGTPTAEDTFATVVTATDELGLTSSEAFTWSILDADPPAIEPIADRDVVDGDSISIQPELTVDDPNVVWSADGLPNGATINPDTGVISGVVRGGGAFTVTVTATDLIGLQGTETFTLNVAGPFIVSESTWRYDDSGRNLRTAWREPDFDDGQWSTGQASFGFNNDETTTWQHNYVTYYARKSFEFDGDVPSSFALRLKADDGAVVYLNGVEILRDNMPDGTITASTTAVDWRIGADEDFKDHVVSAAELVQGTNVIAVEVHNVDADNNDLSFDLSLAASVAPPPAEGGAIVAAGSSWQSLRSSDENPAGWPTQPVGGAIRSAEFGFGDGDEATELNNGEEAYFFTHEFEFSDAIPAGLDLLLKADDGAVVYLNGVEVLRDNMPDGTITANSTAVDWRSGDDEDFKSHVISSAPLVQGRNLLAVQVHNVWKRNNDLSFDLELASSAQAGPDPAEAVVAQDDDELLAAGSTWNYTDSSAGSAPAGWPSQAIAGDSGPAEFGFGDGDEATTLSEGEEAYYFTQVFNVDDPAALTTMTMDLAVDDGAVVYLNGVEIYRLNMPDGTIEPTTRPVTWIYGADETMKSYVVPANALQAGANLVAVEVHNYWPGNSDLTFDLGLSRQ